jgi:hypothetical protein
MSATKEKSQGEIKIKYRKPIQQSLFNKLSCKFLKAFLFFIPPYFKKKKKYVDVSKQQGLPYIVCVENNTSKAIHNVELFGSYDTMTRDVFDKNGYYISRGIKISSQIPNVTYKDILHAFAFMKFKVGLTYIMTVNQKQIFYPLKVVKKMISGDLSEKILIVSKDPYQQQMNIVAVKSDYEIDGFTSVVIPTIEPKTKAIYYFYPDPLAYREVKKENFAFRFFKSISDYFKKKEVAKRPSLPFTIEVANYTDELKKDVSLFGSFSKISPNDNSYFNKGNSLVCNDVLISSLTPNISYAEMLYYIANNPVGIGLNYMRSLEGSKSQITAEFKIRTKDATGNVAQRTIVPSIDPYQQQIDVLSNHQKFRIDGFTEFIISELQPKTTVVYQFYPEVEEVNK